MGDIDPYLKSIPQHNHRKLDKELDFDNDFNRDLIEIAQYITNWQAKLKVRLELTGADVSRILQKEQPNLRQEEVLHVWKEKKKFDATYRNLLKCMVAAEDNHNTAKKICELEIFHEPADTASQEPNHETSGASPQAAALGKHKHARESQDDSEEVDPKRRKGSELDSDVQKNLKQQLEENFRIIKDQYASYVTCIYEKIEAKIEAKKVKVSAVKVHLSNLLSTDDLKDAVTVEDLFHLLRGKTSFIDYQVYESLRQKFLPKGKDKLLRYPKHLVDYLNKHKISEFLRINPGLKEHTSGSKLTLKFGGIEEVDRIAKVLDIQQALATVLSVPTTALRLFDIKRGCVVVTFLVPHHIASTLFPHGLEFTQEQMAQLRALLVERITFNGKEMDILDGVRKPKVQDVSGSFETTSPGDLKIHDDEKRTESLKAISDLTIEDFRDSRDSSSEKLSSKPIPDSTHLPSDIEPLRAANVFKSQRYKLFQVLQLHLSNIAIKLYRESVISAASLADAMNQVHVASVRTESLLSVIEDKIGAEPRVFTEFAKILESEPTLRSLANELVEEYLKGSSEAVVHSNKDVEVESLQDISDLDYGHVPSESKGTNSGRMSSKPALDSTYLPSDIEPQQAAFVLKSQHDSLMLQLQHDLPSIANMLYYKSLIPMTAYEEAMDQVKIPSVRTASLLSVIEEKIRAEPHMFIEFVKILESEPTLRSQSKELVAEYMHLTDPVSVNTSECPPVSFSSLCERFQKMVILLLKELIQNGVKVTDIKNHISALPLPLLQECYRSTEESFDELEQRQTLTGLFHFLDAHVWNFIDYHLLEYVISEFGSEHLKQCMEQYVFDLNDYKNRATVHEFMQFWPTRQKPPNYDDVTVKLGKDPKLYTMKELDEFRQTLSVEFWPRLSDYAKFVTYHYTHSDGLFKVAWSLPPGLVPGIEAVAKSTEGQVFFVQNQVQSVVIKAVGESEPREVYAVHATG